MRNAAEDRARRRRVAPRVDASARRGVAL